MYCRPRGCCVAAAAVRKGGGSAIREGHTNNNNAMKAFPNGSGRTASELHKEAELEKVSFQRRLHEASPFREAGRSAVERCCGYSP